MKVTITGPNMADALLERGANRPCPRCDNTEFLYLDGVVLLVTQQHAAYRANSGPAAPAAMVVCRKCGFIALHNVAALGRVAAEFAN
jgi:ribosomal protein S27AE